MNYEAFHYITSSTPFCHLSVRSKCFPKHPFSSNSIRYDFTLMKASRVHIRTQQLCQKLEFHSEILIFTCYCVYMTGPSTPRICIKLANPCEVMMTAGHCQFFTLSRNTGYLEIAMHHTICSGAISLASIYMMKSSGEKCVLMNCIFCALHQISEEKRLD
jgi:hypothetical protein